MCIRSTRVERVQLRAFKNSARLRFGGLLMASALLAAGSAACNNSSDTPDKECTSADDCATGQICNAHNVCETEQGADCTKDDDCPTGQICSSQNTCEAEQGADCTTDSHCPTGQFCNDDNACENTPVTNPDVARLTTLTDEAPGMNCQHGGQALNSGLDVNEDGVLDEDEVDSTQYNCFPSANSNTVKFFLDIEDIAEGEDCENGGFILHSGYDSDESDALDEAEHQHSITQCYNDACDGSDPLTTQLVILEEDPFLMYDASRTYETRITLSRAVDANTLHVAQYDEAFAEDDDFTWTVDANDDRIVSLEFTPDSGFNTHVMISDACGVTIAQTYIPFGPSNAPGVRVTTEDTPVAGEEFEVCWESRNVSSCTMNIGTFNTPNHVPLPDTEGCMHITVDPGTIYNDEVYSGAQVRCENDDGAWISNSLSFPLAIGVYSFNPSSATSLPSNGGQVSFFIDTRGMESCELIYAGERYPAPLKAQQFAFYAEQSSIAAIECVDADDTVHHSIYSSNPPFIRVGRGITSAGVNTPQDDNGHPKLFIGFTSDYINDGSCEITVTYNGETVELPAEDWVPEGAPNEHSGSIAVNTTLEDVTYVADEPVHLDVTCESSDDFTQSFSHTF